VVFDFRYQQFNHFRNMYCNLVLVTVLLIAGSVRGQNEDLVVKEDDCPPIDFSECKTSATLQAMGMTALLPDSWRKGIACFLIDSSFQMKDWNTTKYVVTLYYVIIQVIIKLC
jgi:hypothetical protein